MKKPALLLCCLLLLLLASCAVDQLQTPAPSSTPAPPSPTPSKTNFWRIVTSTITLPPTKTLPPTFTPTSTATPVPIPTLSPTPIPSELGIIQQYIDVLPEMPENAETNGVVVFRRRPEFFLVDMTTQNISNHENPFDFIVSPDRSRMALRNSSGNDTNSYADYELVIADGNGQRLKTIPWKENWGGSNMEWMDDQHLLLTVNRDHEEYFSLWKFDPFTEAQEGIKLQNTAPGWNEFVEASVGWITFGWPGYSTVKHDPEHTVSLYPTTIEDDHESFTYTLWSIKEQRLVLNLDSIVNMLTGDVFFPQPAWSPDGSQFALGGIVRNDENNRYESELFVITRDGQVKQLTHLADLDDEVFISSPSWSPDGRFIAFYLYPDANWRSRLAILDTYTEKLTDFCVSVKSSNFIYPQPPAPLWSPDGTQLLLVDRYDYDQNSVIWVNPKQGLAAYILEDIVVEYWYSPSEMWGWMAAPEE